jgi:hypothetical protein
MAEFTFTPGELKEIANSIKSALTEQEGQRQTASEQASPDVIDRVMNFYSELLKNRSAYHNHKETMAYYGVAFQIALFGSIMMTEQWPPCWLKNMVNYSWFTFGGIILLWLLILVYIRWQLLNRRKAAIENAAIIESLVNLITIPPSFAELRIDEENKKGWKNYINDAINWFVPVPSQVRTDIERTYPNVLRTRIENLQKTGALFHELIFFIASILLWSGIAYRTLADWVIPLEVTIISSLLLLILNVVYTYFRRSSV